MVKISESLAWQVNKKIKARTLDASKQQCLSIIIIMRVQVLLMIALAGKTIMHRTFIVIHFEGKNGYVTSLRLGVFFFFLYVIISLSSMKISFSLSFFFLIINKMIRTNFLTNWQGRLMVQIHQILSNSSPIHHIFHFIFRIRSLIEIHYNLKQ